MLVVIPDDFHVPTDLSEQSAFLLPAFAPSAEVAFELRLMLPAIVVIVVVEFAHVAVAPAAIVRVRVALVTGAVRQVRRAGSAGAAIFVAAPGGVAPFAVAVVIAKTAFAAPDATC